MSMVTTIYGFLLQSVAQAHPKQALLFSDLYLVQHSTYIHAMMAIIIRYYIIIMHSVTIYLFAVTVQPRLSELLIIRTRDAKKKQGQSTYCDHVTGLCMCSKHTSCRCHARTSCCTAIKSSFNAQKSKRNAW